MMNHSRPLKIQLRRNAMAWLALLPMALTALVAYLGTMVWSLQISFSSSRMLPKYDFVGLQQYERLFESTRWITSLENLALIALLFLFFCLLIGFLLAVFLDQNIRGEGLLRSIFLYPYAMSFIVTGLIWQWMLNPQLGIEKFVRDLGFDDFRFSWLVDPDRVVYAILIAAIWQASGLVMALMLAGLRGIDSELWKATRIDGIPAWRVYLSIVLPMLKPMIVTALVLLSLGVVKMYDVVVAMTGGGPGIASDVPAKFVMDNLFERANIGLAMAASSVLLLSALCIAMPFIYAHYVRPQRPARG